MLAERMTKTHGPCFARFAYCAEEDETYYDAMKREMAERMTKTKAVMDALDPAQRVAMEVGDADD